MTFYYLSLSFVFVSVSLPLSLSLSLFGYQPIIGRPMGYRSDNNSPVGPIHGLGHALVSSRGPLLGISVMPRGISPPSNIRHLLQVPKAEISISKVGPLLVRNNPKGSHLHKKD